MAELKAEVAVTGEVFITVRAADGHEMDLAMDDSFRDWLKIVRWNWRYGHIYGLRLNAVDLFRKVLWRKVTRWLPF